MREGNRVCGASFVPLAALKLQIPPSVASLTLFLLVCVAGQPGARPTVYVRGIIRISYGAGMGRRGGGVRGGKDQQRWLQRRDCAEAKEIHGTKRKRWVEKVGLLLEACFK